MYLKDLIESLIDAITSGDVCYRFTGREHTTTHRDDPDSQIILREVEICFYGYKIRTIVMPRKKRMFWSAYAFALKVEKEGKTRVFTSHPKTIPGERSEWIRYAFYGIQKAIEKKGDIPKNLLRCLKEVIPS